jgi:aconitate hydratase
VIRNNFGARDKLNVGYSTFEIFRLDALDDARRLPYSLKVLLENLLRNEDGRLITAIQITALQNWDASAISTVARTKPSRSNGSTRSLRI